MTSWIAAGWSAAANVHVVTTTRSGGASEGPWASLNLGGNTGDDAASVALNRTRVAQSLPEAPNWLRQVHGTDVIACTDIKAGESVADAVTCSTPGRVCAILTADCLPVALCSRSGDEVALAHAGWRGLAAGVLESTVTAMHSDPSNLLAWIGPGIGADAFEIGDEVRDAFLAAYPGCASAFHRPANRWHADLAAIARYALGQLGIGEVTGGNFCTYTDRERFYSYRRDGETGRMATLAWIDQPLVAPG